MVLKRADDDLKLAQKKVDKAAEMYRNKAKKWVFEAAKLARKWRFEGKTEPLEVYGPTAGMVRYLRRGG